MPISCGGEQMQRTIDMTQHEREVLKLSEALLLCQRELAQVREQQEPLEERCCQLQADSSDSQTLSLQLAQALADQLAGAFWKERRPTAPITWRRFIGSRWPWLREHFGGGRTDFAEDDQVRMIETSPLFDAAWYLRQYADVARAGIHPAAHYLRSGAQENRNPGPGFSTREYIAGHPELEESGMNPLVHHLREQSGRNVD